MQRLPSRKAVLYDKDVNISAWILKNESQIWGITLNTHKLHSNNREKVSLSTQQKLHLPKAAPEHQQKAQEGDRKNKEGGKEVIQNSSQVIMGSL